MSDDQLIDMKPVPANFHGHHGEVMAKREYVNYLIAGIFPEEAAERTGLTLSQVNLWRKRDPIFDEQCDIALASLRDAYLPAIEANIMQAALSPTKEGVKTAMWVAERLDPQTWGKQTAQDAQPQHKHISSWLDDPAIIDIELKEDSDVPDDE